MEKRRAKYEAAADIIIETDGKNELEICEDWYTDSAPWMKENNIT